MEKILFLIGISLFVSCNMTNNYESDKIFNKTFSEEEISDINYLIDHVDSLVITETGSEAINTAYPLYFEKLLTSMHANNYIVPIKNNEKFRILGNIKENTFNEFWTIDSIKPEKHDTNRFFSSYNEVLTINLNGKYIDYINQIGKSDSIYFDLHDNIVSMGDFPKTGAIQFLTANKSVDFNLVKHRLLAMYCIISISEPFEKFSE